MKRKHNVTIEDIGIRIDKLMLKLEPSYARNQIQQWIKNGHLLVNKKQIKPNYKCKEHDQIEWTILEEAPVTILPEAIILDVLYEDDYIVVINKPKGMLIHPTKQVQTNTLVNGLIYHFKNLSTLSGDERPGIVHRLDKDTSGVLVIAKDNMTHAHLQEQFKKQTVIRQYEAIVDGIVGPNKGIIKAPIGRHPTQRLKRMVLTEGKNAETHFVTLQRMNSYTHLQCKLITGRTHQIRVHLDYMGHSIIGDTLYNPKQNQLLQGQALFAKEIQFVHPNTNEIMTFSVQAPTYFTNLLQKLERMS